MHRVRSMASLLHVGTCILHAAQAGNTNYSAAPAVSQGFYVHPAKQTITFQDDHRRLVRPAADHAERHGQLRPRGEPRYYYADGLLCLRQHGSLLIGGSCILQASQSGSSGLRRGIACHAGIAVHLAHQSITVIPTWP